MKNEPLPFGELGRLEYDPVEDALLCHVCGRWVKSLAQHARLSHELDADDYRELTGLNRQTKLVTPTMRKRLSEIATPLIARLRGEGKLKRWNEDPEKWQQCKEDAVKSIEDGKRAEGRRHQSESWDSERRQERAEFRRQRNLAGLDRACPEAIGEGLHRYYHEHPEAAAANAERMKQYAKVPKATEKTARDVVCPRCQETFRAMSHRDKYCPSCRPVVEREYNTEWRRKWLQKRATKESSPQ